MVKCVAGSGPRCQQLAAYRCPAGGRPHRKLRRKVPRAVPDGASVHPSTEEVRHVIGVVNAVAALPGGTCHQLVAVVGPA